jgi:alkanesulfonate monooxygenase SsuD/methylene tetrahydromethanopterin reductase-like flavin-dependent oxidoreductase (luciferase family)
VVAGYAATMSKLTRNRFALGIGRGTDQFAALPPSRPQRAIGESRALTP